MTETEQALALGPDADATVSLTDIQHQGGQRLVGTAEDSCKRQPVTDWKLYWASGRAKLMAVDRPALPLALLICHLLMWSMTCWLQSFKRVGFAQFRAVTLSFLAATAIPRSEVLRPSALSGSSDSTLQRSDLNRLRTVGEMGRFLGNTMCDRMPDRRPGVSKRLSPRERRGRAPESRARVSALCGA